MMHLKWLHALQNYITNNVLKSPSDGQTKCQKALLMRMEQLFSVSKVILTILAKALLIAHRKDKEWDQHS